MIARKSTVIILILIINGIIGYAGLKIIALYMTPEEYGVVGFAFGFVALFSIVGNLGFNSAHVKRISEGKDLATCISTFCATKTFLAGLLAVLTILSVFVWKYLLGRGFESSLHEQAIYVMLVYYILSTLSQSFTSTFYAKRESAKAQIPLLVYTIMRVLATVFVALNDLGVLALAYTYVFGELFQFSLAFYFMRGYPIGKPSLAYLKSYTSFAFPLALATASSFIMTNIDKVIIQLFWSSQQVGEYFAVFNLSRFLLNFSAAVSLLLLPTVSQLHSKGNINKIRELVSNSERYLSMIIFPIIVMMVVLAQPIIHILLSDKYFPAIPILQILPFFALLEILSGPYQSQLQGMNMPNVIRDRMIIMVIVNVILNIILIPTDIKSLGIQLAGLGPTGAAIATVVAYFIGFVTTRVFAMKKIGIKGNFKVLIHGFAATVMGIVLYLFSQQYYIGRWFQLAAICLFGFAIYFIILFIIKEFKKDDFYFFFDNLNIKKMIMYLKDEIIGK